MTEPGGPILTQSSVGSKFTDAHNKSKRYFVSQASDKAGVPAVNRIPFLSPSGVSGFNLSDTTGTGTTAEPKTNAPSIAT